MSEYPSCVHGWSDPNFNCPQCESEKEKAELGMKLNEVRWHIGRVLKLPSFKNPTTDTVLAKNILEELLKHL